MTKDELAEAWREPAPARGPREEGEMRDGPRVWVRETLHSDPIGGTVAPNGDHGRLIDVVTPLAGKRTYSASQVFQTESEAWEGVVQFHADRTREYERQLNAARLRWTQALAREAEEQEALPDD